MVTIYSINYYVRWLTGRVFFFGKTSIFFLQNYLYRGKSGATLEIHLGSDIRGHKYPQTQRPKIALLRVIYVFHCCDLHFSTSPLTLSHLHFHSILPIPSPSTIDVHQ